MRPVRVDHDGGGVFHYGHPGQQLGRFRFEPHTLAVESVERPERQADDPYLTAALAGRRHWQVTGTVPDRLEVAKPECDGLHPPPAHRQEREQVVRSGRLRRPDLKPMSMAEFARRHLPDT